MTVGLTDLLDLAICPEIGPVNFFHLRNLLHTIVEHFGIGEIEAQQAEIVAPGGYEGSEASSSKESSSEDSDSDNESDSEESEPEIEVVEEEVTQTVVDEDGTEKTVTVTVQKQVVKEPSEKKKDGESKKKHKDKDKDKDKDGKDKDKSEKKDKKDKKSKSEKDVDEKEGKKSKKDKDKGGYGSSAYGKEAYGGKEKKKLTFDNIGDMPEIVNLERRIDAAETGIKSLRNIIDSMVNQVDFGDDVGSMLKAQLDQVQQQMNKVELIPKDEPKEKKKKKGSKSKVSGDIPQSGIITEGGSAAPESVITSATGAPGDNLIATVIPPPSQRGQDMPKGQRTSSRKDAPKVGIPLKGDKVRRPESQETDKPPLKKRTTMRDLQLRKKAREEGVTIEEIESKETEADEKKKDKTKDDNEKDDKGKKDDDADETSSEESLDSAEEQAAMDEMIMEEIEAALENAADDPEAQAYALRLGLEQMTNMKKSLTQAQEDFRRDMDKNKKAIDQLARELSMFRAARKAQDAEGFNAVHHVHSMVLELQTKHDKIMATTAELVDEYNRREKALEELYNHVDRLDLNKADKQDVNKDIKVKADKMDLENKVSVNQFDESFNLLDRGLNEALEKMDNQMSVEDALKETLLELQSKLSLKLDRNEIDNLRSQLESRIKEIQVVKAVVREKPADGEPAGFRRNVTEKVHCISCDRPLEVQPGSTQLNMPPKMQSLPSHKSAKPYTTYELEHIRQHQKMNMGLRKAVIGADLPYTAQKIKNEVAAMTGLVDLVDLPPSQRYCGGSHTIMHPFRRSFKTTSSHFNQYVMIREDGDAAVPLPRRDFIVPKDSQLKRYTKSKLPAIGQTNNRGQSPPLDYDTYNERPSSAPATPSLLSHRNGTNNVRRSMSPPKGDVLMSPPPQDGDVSPVELGRISVTIPTPATES